MNSNPATGYSAYVRLQLILSDRTLELSSIGPDGISLREPAEICPCDAEVVMFVNDHERRWPVSLPDGISANSREVRTVTQPASPAAR
jgi:hypothetical protein